MAAPNARFSPFEQINNRIKDRSRNQENSARLASAYGSYETTGWGEFIPEDSIQFDAPYLYRPSVSYCASLSTEVDAEKLRATRYPICSGIVARWDIDVNGFYRGAWVAIVVLDRNPLISPTDPDPDPNYLIVHDFTFNGVGLKDTPSHISGDEGAV